MMTIREYKRAESLEEAWQLNQKKANRILGGMIWLKMETINVGTAIDLSGLGLDTIEETDVGFSIGAMVTLRQLETHPGLEAFTHGAVREALHHIVGVQLRNLATVGGSIYSRFGFSDVLTLFLAMDCSVELYKGGIVPLREYAERPYDRDIVVRLLVRKEAADYCYQSVRNSQTDIPVLTCAAARLQDGSYRFAVGARPLKAVLYEEPAAPAQQHARQRRIPPPPDWCAGAACSRRTGKPRRTGGNLNADQSDAERSARLGRCGSRYAAHRLCAQTWMPERQTRLRNFQLRLVHGLSG